MTHTKQKVAIRIAAAITMILAMLVSVSFAGCQMTSLLPTNNEQQSSTTTVEQLADDQPKPDPIIIPDYLSPLTGLGCLEEIQTNRPISITIGNTANALPQFGLSNAGILVEIPVEGGISRLMMITNDYADLEKIGSVRSTRPALAQIANSFDAIQLYAGTSDEEPSALLPYDTLDYITQNLPTIYYRDTSRNAPHNLMTTGALALAGIQSFQYRTSLNSNFALPFSFVAYGENATPSGASALTAQISYSSSHLITFTYDSEMGQYMRSQFSEPQIDGNTKSQIAFENVFILFTNTTTHESASGSTMDLSLSKGGSGVWCSNGTRQTIKWTIDADDHLAFFDEDGNALICNRGTSYIGFVRATQTNSVEIQ